MSPERGGPIRGKRILVVEDEPLIAGLLSEILVADGHTVDMAATGREALARLDAASYDLIVSDLRMPELDGPGLFRELERRPGGLARRIVFVTGSAVAAGNEDFLARSRAPWIAKPFNITALHELTQRVLRDLAAVP